MADKTPAIQLKGITKSFGDNHVLKGVDLSVDKGQSLVLIGGSGTGKTLIMKLILSLVHPDKGQILIDGQDCTGLTGDRHMAFLGRFGMSFQKSGLFDSLPVWQNVAFQLLQDKSIDPAQAKDRALQKLVDVGLDEDVGMLLPAELSGGMQKRVGLARAVVADPEFVLLDEPTAGLDPIMSNVINDLIIELVNKTGATALSITSDMVSAQKISDKIAMIHDGRIIWHGPSDQATKSDNPYLDQFIHSRAEGPIQMALKAI